jgi:hypothetical protein
MTVPAEYSFRQRKTVTGYSLFHGASPAAVGCVIFSHDMLRWVWYILGKGVVGSEVEPQAAMDALVAAYENGEAGE